MATSMVRVPPDPQYKAEVVVLLTTLGAKRVEYNAGKRVRDLLEIFRAHHKVVDFNRDARQAGSGEAENIAIQTLMGQGKLQCGNDDDLILPQVFIDGGYAGNAYDLQKLIDDYSLAGILQRNKCMECLAPVDAHAGTSWECPKCKAEYKEILPDMMTIEQALQDYAYGDSDESSEGGEESADDAPAPAVEKIVTPAAPSSGGGGYNASAAASAPAAKKPSSSAKAPEYKVGDILEVLRSNGTWNSCTVTKIKDDGAVLVRIDGTDDYKTTPKSGLKSQLRYPQAAKEAAKDKVDDSKMAAKPSEKKPAAAPAAQFKVGDSCLILRSNGSWSPSTVKDVKDDGSVVVRINGTDDCKTTPKHCIQHHIRSA